MSRLFASGGPSIGAPASASVLAMNVPAKSLQSCPTLCDPWTAACQAPLSMGFSRQEYWSRLPFPSPRTLSAEELMLLNCSVRRLLRVPWTARRSNQSILKEISPGCSLEGLMLELKLQYFGHLMRRTDSLEKTWMLGKIEGRRRRR